SQSHIPTLENKILSFIYARRGRLLLERLLDDLERHLTEFNKYFTVAQKALSEDVAKMEERVACLKRELAEVQRGIEHVRTIGDRFKGETEAWVREQFGQFQAEIDDFINHALAVQQDGKFQRWGLQPGRTHQTPPQLSRGG